MAERLKDSVRHSPHPGLAQGDQDPREFFNFVYASHYWSGKESRSGPGSEGEPAAQKISYVKALIPDLQVSSILDVGCGDMYWMRQILDDVDLYHGVDLVREVVARNEERFSSERASFQCLDLSSPEEQSLLSPREYDLAICFDVLGHMLNEEIDRLLPFLVRGLEISYLFIINRRDEMSERYLERPKSRHEGINLEVHPFFRESDLAPICSLPALSPGDHFELYDLGRCKRELL